MAVIDSPLRFAGNGRTTKAGRLTVGGRPRHWRHYWTGRRDGSRFLPLLEPDAAPPAHLLAIATACARDLEHRWNHLLEATQPGRDARSRLMPELARAQVRRDIARYALSEHLASSPSLKFRFGEERMPEDLIRRRRLREHERATSSLTADRDRTRNYVTQLEQQRGAIESQMSLDLEVAQSEARELHQVHNRAISSYLHGAQRTHSDPAGLVRFGPTFAPELPEWVTLNGLPAFLRASGAESGL